MDEDYDWTNGDARKAIWCAPLDYPVDLENQCLNRENLQMENLALSELLEGVSQ